MRSATENAARLGLDQVRFAQADLTTWTTSQRFDAITGRLITMYLPDASGSIAALARFVRPGGVVLLQEFAMSASTQEPETPLFRQTLNHVLAAFRVAGAPTDLGYGLGRLFRGAGLGRPTMSIDGRWEDGRDATAYALLVGITRTLLPVMIGSGIATAAEMEIETLEERLRTVGAEVDAGCGHRCS